MRVVLPQQLFETAGLFELDGLLHVLVEREHSLQVAPPWVPGDLGSLDRWLKRREREYRDLWRVVLESDLQDNARQPTCTLEVQVITSGESHWPELRLSLADAAELLGAPLRLFLEDKSSDRSFLWRVADPRQRIELDRAEREKRLLVEHGGGNTRMKKSIEELHLRRRATDSTTNRPAWIESWRLWVLFDRDAARGDATSMHEHASALRAACERLRIPHHSTGRRTIENYLPVSALHRWADLGPRTDRSRRRRRVAAYCSDTFGRQRQDCLHMKEGLKKDLVDERLPPPFEGLDLSIPPWSELRDGFGSDIADAFEDNSIPDRAFQEVFERDVEARELRARIFTSLFGRL